MADSVGPSAPMPLQCRHHVGIEALENGHQLGAQARPRVLDVRVGRIVAVGDAQPIEGGAKDFTPGLKERADDDPPPRRHATSAA